MADIRCSHCGKDNPDFLDVCQFCQSPLKSESMLHIGQKPTKKNTGELEGVLPDWLKNARQQGRDSAEEDAAHAAAQPKVQKDEPVDLLAGLFQSDSSEEEDVPDWLSSINQSGKGKPAAAPAQPEPETDFFAQFNKSDIGSKKETAPEPPPTPQSAPAQPADDSAGRDELSAWFAQASEQPVDPFAVDRDAPQASSDWGIGNEIPLRETPAPKEEEDLSWLRDLESAARQTDELKSAQPGDWERDFGTPSQSSAPEDLSWLNNLGGLPGSEPTSAQPAPQEDLSWLDSLGGVSPPVPADTSTSQDDLGWLDALGGTAIEQTPSQPAKPQEDLSWLNNLGAPSPDQTPAPSEAPQDDLSWLKAFSESPESSQQSTSPASSQNDLGWLNTLGSTSVEPALPSQPSTQDDLSWLSALQGGEPEPLSAAPFAEPVEDESVMGDSYVSPFVPRKTAPLDPGSEDSMPDWLKSAAEGPSMPMSASALDQFREDFKIPTTPEEAFSWKSFTQEAKPAEEQPSLSAFFSDQAKPEAGSVDSGLLSADNAPAAPSADDVNSLFSIEMPDWLTQAEPAKEDESAAPAGIHAEGGETLAPVDLPSWVQAMRPMDAVITESAPSIDDQPTEREGPLAGFRGLIPVMPVGSARRPKPISLKLQASDEQQASASILEQLLASETSPRALVSAQTYAPQRTLRQMLTVLFMLVLGAVIFMRSQILPISPVLTVDSGEISNRLQGIPESANVLVVMDYEPALAGELEAVTGPLLDQLVVLRHPKLSFVSTGPNGPALVERLMLNTNINNSAANGGVTYTADQNYFNLGFLPGAESGVLTFMQSPALALPKATVTGFSDYAAVILLTDNADSARTWIEQLQAMKQSNSALELQPLIVASSAQAGPMLQPYVSSRQINGLITGIAVASRFEFGNNNSRPGIARSYWDAFGVGLLMAIGLIVLGSLWSIFAGIRARRAEAAEG